VAYNPPLQVVGYIATRASDAERGPLLRLRTDDAQLRAIASGELVWVYGPTRHELAPAVFDDTLPRGGVVVRDLAGIVLTDVVHLVKVDDERTHQIPFVNR
jgi:anaerobic selenocysteine-containing dehydrogenase